MLSCFCIFSFVIIIVFIAVIILVITTNNSEYNEFLDDLELEDATYRQNINIYRGQPRPSVQIPFGIVFSSSFEPIILFYSLFAPSHSDPTVATDDESEANGGISLAEMLDDLVIGEDATGEAGSAMME